MKQTIKNKGERKKLIQEIKQKIAMELKAKQKIIGLNKLLEILDSFYE